MGDLTKKAFVSNKDETPRLFQSDWMEALTKVHPATPLVIFGPVVGYFFWDALREFNIFSVLGLFVFGFVFWTFFEYALHRTVFHLEPKNSWGKKLHFIFHGIHHDYPKDSRRLVMPPIVSIALSSLIYWSFKKILPADYVGGIFSGFMFGYLCYDLGHFAIHHYNFKNKWFVMIRNHHIVHHYQDEHSNFGVSSPLWDLLVGTLKK